MHYVVGMFGLVVFLLLAWLPSSDRGLVLSRAKWIALLLAIQVTLGLVMLKTEPGRNALAWVGARFGDLLGFAWEGVAFVFGSLAGTQAHQVDPPVPFFFAVLLPIIFVSALIGILQYLRVLPLIIRYLGLVLSKVNGLGRLESFNGAASLILGQSEVFISVKNLLPHLNEKRLYTLCASAMSTVSASILGAYVTMIDAKFVFTAVIMNLFGAFIVVQIINPYELTEEDKQLGGDIAGTPHRSFFEMLGEYIMDGAKVALAVAAMLIGFIALMGMLNGICRGLFNGTTFDQILGYAFSPLAWLTGVPWSEATAVGSHMATKLVTNEFVAMINLGQTNPPPGSGVAPTGTPLSERSYAICSTFLVSFANFSSIGIIAGAVKSLNPQKGDSIAKFGLKLLYGASLVSFISATIVGLIY